MGRTKEDFGDTLVKLGIFLGALWLGAEVVRSLSDYTCPSCNAKVIKGTMKCPECNQNIYWPGDFG